MSEHTPTTASIRSDYIRGTAADFIATEGKRCPCGGAHPVRSETARVALVWDAEARTAAGPEFDRWYAAEIRKAKAEAWEDGHSWGWSDAQEAHDVRQHMDRADWDLRMPNPYREEDDDE